LIVYEVTLAVETGSSDSYLAWLREHVAQMLALPGFATAEIFAVVDDDPRSRRWCVQYRLRDAVDLDAYFAQHAARMRAEGLARFGDAVVATRRVLRPVP
jgi:antibiotic biosynthesis monooxygenase (ABM) superfamily enzyme